MMYSIVIPVYRNEASLPDLLQTLENFRVRLKHPLEVVFAIDGSPDGSLRFLRSQLPGCRFQSRIVVLSRNFGSFAAIRAGMQNAEGDFIAVMAADLQEPMQLIFDFFSTLEQGGTDVVIGKRMGRKDPWLSRTLAHLFWSQYRRFVQKEMPEGGADVFACNRRFRDELLALGESNTSLVGLALWLGFRREFVPYEREERQYGVSAWTFLRKFRYLMDSVFAFSDLPISLLLATGFLGMALALVLGTAALIAKLTGAIPVSGYAATILVILFFGASQSFALGAIGSYVWRGFENTKKRPSFLVQETFEIERKANESLRSSTSSLRDELHR